MSTIHIKKSHEGRFTAYKKRTGKTTEEALHSSNPHVRQMANFARNAAKWSHAFGGPLDLEYALGGYVDPYNPMAMGAGMFADGGSIESNGINWDNGLTEFNVGGTHEENPYNGIPQGMGSNGKENKVEQGETKWNDYIFSNRLTADTIPPEMLQRLGIKKYNPKNPLTFADISKKIQKESKEMPNDPISKRGSDSKLGLLRELQESVKQQMQQQQQIQQQAQYALGGNLFDEGGPIIRNFYNRTDAIQNEPLIRAKRLADLSSLIKASNTPKARQSRRQVEQRRVIDNILRNQPQLSQSPSKAIQSVYNKEGEAKRYDEEQRDIRNKTMDATLKAADVAMLLDGLGGAGKLATSGIRALSELGLKNLAKDAVGNMAKQVAEHPIMSALNLGLGTDAAYNMYQNPSAGNALSLAGLLFTPTIMDKKIKVNFADDIADGVKNNESINKLKNSIENSLNKGIEKDMINLSDIDLTKLDDDLNSYLMHKGHIAFDNDRGSYFNGIKKIDDSLYGSRNFPVLHTVEKPKVTAEVKPEVTPAIEAKPAEEGTLAVDNKDSEAVTEAKKKGWIKRHKVGIGLGLGLPFLGYAGKGIYNQIKNSSSDNDYIINSKGEIVPKSAPDDINLNDSISRLSPDSVNVLNAPADSTGLFNEEAYGGNLFSGTDNPTNQMFNWNNVSPEEQSYIRNYLGYAHQFGQALLDAHNSYLSNGNNKPAVTVNPTVQQPSNTQAAVNYESIPWNMKGKWDWLQYAPVIGSAVGVFNDVLGNTNRPDYSYGNMIADSAGRSGQASFTPIGEYLKYQPLDRQYYLNQLNAGLGSAYNGLRDNSGGNRAALSAGLLAAQANYNNGVGDNGIRMDMSNFENKARAIAQHNALDEFNSQGDMQRSIYNMQRYRNILAALGQAAQLNMYQDTQAANARSINLTNLFNNLGEVGKNSEQRAWLANLARHGVFGALGKDNNVGAFGGYLSKKKKQHITY